MIRRPPRSTRTDTLFPYTTLFRSQDDFGILLQYGADCIGAVGVLPADGIVPVHHVDGSVVEEAAVTSSRTISGVQRKLLAWHDGTTFRPSVGPGDPATHIAKSNHNDEPTLVQNESLILRLAREILGENEVTRGEPATVIGIDGLALLVERFDRLDGERLRLRSEEHTSELQSLMRISYAVFCLKKKNITTK